MLLVMIRDWCLGISQVSLAILLALATRRKLYKELPWFYAYLAFQTARCGIQSGLSLTLGYDATFYFYWSTDVIDALLNIGIIREVYAKTFAGYESWRASSRRVFHWSLGVLGVLCAISAYLFPGSNLYPIISVLTVMERSVAVLVAGMLFAFLVLTAWAGISWRSRTVGVATGMMVYSAILATAESVQSTGHFWSERLAFTISNDLGYILAVCIWALYVARQTVEVRVEASSTEAALLRDWNSSLEAISQPK